MHSPRLISSVFTSQPPDHIKLQCPLAVADAQSRIWAQFEQILSSEFEVLNSRRMPVGMKVRADHRKTLAASSQLATCYAASISSNESAVTGLSQLEPPASLAPKPPAQFFSAHGPDSPGPTKPLQPDTEQLPLQS